MPGRSRTPTPRVRATLARQAETVDQAAGLLGDGIELDAKARAALVGLLSHLASEGAREVIDTISWDRVMRLSHTIVEPHRPPAPLAGPLPPGYTNATAPRDRQT